jgi:hypothetical protein
LDQDNSSGRNDQDVEHQEVKAIVKELGYLPLAVTLAGTLTEIFGSSNYSKWLFFGRL